MQIPQLAGLLPATSQDAAPVAGDPLRSGFADAFDASQATDVPAEKTPQPLAVAAFPLGKTIGREQVIAFFGLPTAEVAPLDTDFLVQTEIGISEQIDVGSPKSEPLLFAKEDVQPEGPTAQQDTIATEVAVVSVPVKAASNVAAQPAILAQQNAPESTALTRAPASPVHTAAMELPSKTSSEKLDKRAAIATDIAGSPLGAAHQNESAKASVAATDHRPAEPKDMPPRQPGQNALPDAPAGLPNQMAPQAQAHTASQLKSEHGKAVSREAPAVRSETRPAKPDTPDNAVKVALSGTTDEVTAPTASADETPVEFAGEAAKTGETKSNGPNRERHIFASHETSQTAPRPFEKAPTAMPAGVPPEQPDLLAQQKDKPSRTIESNPAALNAVGPAVQTPVTKTGKIETRDAKPTTVGGTMELTEETDIKGDVRTEKSEPVAGRQTESNDSDPDQTDKLTFAPSRIADSMHSAGSTDFDANSALRSVDGAAPLSETRAASPMAAAPPVAHHSAQVLSQMAEAAKALGDRPVELTLNPEELGRVRMTLHSTNGEMAIAVTAERPETLDLIRRNLNDLAAQFRDIGFRDISFSLGQQGTGQASPDQSQAGQGPARFETADAVIRPAELAPHRLNISSSGGMDIRL